jgi:serine/threonine protein kinase HipA of HipAB toxin-antitoxin module
VRPRRARQIWCGKTTNETFKWDDLYYDLQDEARRKGEADPKKKAKALMPPNIYSRGFWRNVYEVLYPLSSRPVQGFKQARQVGGAMLGFAPRLDGKPRADEADTEGDESSDEAQPVDASAHPHAD